MAARSLRPETAHDLAHALEAKGETDQAIVVFQDLARLRPKDGKHLFCLGAALKSRGRNQEAKVILDNAIAALRAAIAHKPDFPAAHNLLGFALRDQGKLDEAIAEYRTALRLKPGLSEAHYNLGNALRAQGEFTEALAELR
jgi:Flp pilus assembly protein TadD